MLFESRNMQDEISSYTGEQIVPNYFRQRYKSADTGRSLIYHWTSPCDVQVENMKDVDDVREELTIKSGSMSHIIVECKNYSSPLELVLIQRTLTRVVCDHLNWLSEIPEMLHIEGNDILLTDQAGSKLSVSIAVPYPHMGMIHFGYNVDSTAGPEDVNICGLDTLKIQATSETVLCTIVDLFIEELEDCMSDAFKAAGAL